MTNWTDIHPNFTNILQAEWEDRNFTFNQVKEWIDIGFTPSDYEFVGWLQEEGYTALAVLNENDAERLRNEYQASFILKRPLFEWYSDGQLTLAEFSWLGQELADKGKGVYSWKEIKNLLTNYQLKKANYPLTKLILAVILIVTIIYLLTN